MLAESASSLFGPVGTAYFAALILNAALAIACGDWRLRRVIALFLMVWFVTSLFPYTEVVASPLSFVILSVLQLRRPGEEKLSWWMVPLILAEAGIFLAHAFFVADNYFLYWGLVQVFFALQLAVTLGVGVQLTLRRASRSAHVKRNALLLVAARSQGLQQWP